MSCARKAALVFALVSILVAGSAGVAEAAPLVWTAPSLSRIGTTDAAGSGTSIEVYAGKGEVESFQIGIQAPAGGLSNVNVSVSSLTGSGGTIPNTSLILFAEHYVYVSSNSPNWGGSNQPLPLGNGYFADGLVPFNNPATGASLSGSGAQYVAVPFNLSAGINQPIWVDVSVPRTAVAGTYTGTYTVSSNQGNVTGAISLTVWNFAYPVSPSEKSSFLPWVDNSLSTQELLLQNGIDPVSASPGNEPVLMNQYGLNDNGAGYYSGAYAGNCVMSAAPTVAQFQAAVAANPVGLFLYEYSADEIGGCPNLFPSVIQWAQNMHQAGVSNLVTMAPNTALFNDGLGTGRSAVDVWVELPEEYNANIPTTNAALAKGDQVWSYNAVVQDAYSPKWEIDFAPINYRIQPGFINATLGLSGVLYWKIDSWSSDPWNNVNNTGQFSSANYPGEGLLAYPGAQVGIAGDAPSMRLKWIRDGIKDYEYVQLLKQAGQGAWALSQAATVGPDWTNWTRSTSALMNVRLAMGQMLNSLNGGPSPTPSPSPLPTQTPAGVTTVSASPSSGTGLSQTFQFTFSDSAGAADIAGGHVLINTSYSGVNACWVYFNASASQLFLAGNDTTSWTGPITLGSGSLVNSQCTINGAGASLTRSGTNLVLTLPITFSTSFSGTRNVYLDATSNEGASSGSILMGTWTVAQPAVTSVTPSSGSGLSQVFKFKFVDNAGYADVQGVHVLIGPSVTTTSACWIYFSAATRTLSLANNATTSWTQATLGSSTVLSNSQCKVSAKASTSSGSGSILSLSLSVTFTGGFTGAKNVYGSWTSDEGVSTPYEALGTWRP